MGIALRVNMAEAAEELLEVVPASLLREGAWALDIVLKLTALGYFLSDISNFALLTILVSVDRICIK